MEQPAQDNLPKKNMQKIERLYTFFQQAERTGRRFRMTDIRDEVGYTLKTANAYRTKKWYAFVFPDQQQAGMYYCDGLKKITKEQFVTMHQQKWMQFLGIVAPAPLVIEKPIERIVGVERVVYIRKPICIPTHFSRRITLFLCVVVPLISISQYYLLWRGSKAVLQVVQLCLYRLKIST